MSKMNEQSQQDEERENISGSGDYEAYMHEQNAAQQALAATDDRPITVNKEN